MRSWPSWASGSSTSGTRARGSPPRAAESLSQLTARAKKYEVDYSLTSFLKTRTAAVKQLFCLFDDTNYEDRRVALKRSWSNLNDLSFGDKASSVKNRSSVAWVIYDTAASTTARTASSPAST